MVKLYYCEKCKVMTEHHHYVCQICKWRGKDKEKCPDGPRYKALGNSMAVNVMRWIGERIDSEGELL